MRKNNLGMAGQACNLSSTKADQKDLLDYSKREFIFKKRGGGMHVCVKIKKRKK